MAPFPVKDIRSSILSSILIFRTSIKSERNVYRVLILVNMSWDCQYKLCCDNWPIYKGLFHSIRFWNKNSRQELSKYMTILLHYIVHTTLYCVICSDKMVRYIFQNMTTVITSSFLCQIFRKFWGNFWSSWNYFLGTIPKLSLRTI